MPGLAVQAALALHSPDGRSYRERIDAVTTERELSEIFEEFIGMVPLGRTLLADSNPVRTGGPMQVGVTFAQIHLQTHAYPYPYPVQGSIRHEVLTRRGGLYFGVAHLLDYEAPYDRLLYRFADFNVGRYASRNAGFQNALSLVTGTPLVLDGDLLAPGSAGGAASGSTEAAAYALAGRIDMSVAQIRRDLEKGEQAGFDRTRLSERVRALAERLDQRALPLAVLPRITLQSPKIRRKLTTEWFARSVDERWQRCLARDALR